MWKFQVRIFQRIWEISRQRASWPGRAGSGRAGSSRISILHRKRITFCSVHHIAKINISRVMMLFCFPIWLWLRRSTRRFASRLSPPLANYQVTNKLLALNCIFNHSWNSSIKNETKVNFSYISFIYYCYLSSNKTSVCLIIFEKVVEITETKKNFSFNSFISYFYF